MPYKKKYLPLIMGTAIAAGIFIGSKLDFNDGNNKIFATNSKKDKLNRLIDYIDYEYVDQVNTDSIVDVTVLGILENLDPHSTYVPANQYEENADDMRGNFVGIGISFYMSNDSISVIRAIPNGPAHRAGLHGGDRILSADGVKLHGENIHRDSVGNYLKGAINSTVRLQVHRRATGRTFGVNLTRKRIPIASVDAQYKLTENLGYIKINRFAQSTYGEFKKALKKLEKEGASRLVLDLRDNPGGYISSAEKIADEFLKNGKLILITKNKSGEVTQSFATRRGSFEQQKVYVLINENTASASEIVAGALQDNDRGIIVGRRSFGKGLVQREMALGDGSAIQLTIARYYTPTGRSIQKPYGNGNEMYYRDYEKRYNNGELISADSIKVADSLKFVTPKGKVVYGGGGIIPDVFVGKDTSMENETIQFIGKSGYMNSFVFEYLDQNRNQFKDLTFNEYLNDFNPGQGLVKQFIAYANLERSRIDQSSYSDRLKAALKANIAQQLFGNSAFQFLLNEGDPVLLKVLQMDGGQPPGAG